MTESEAKQLLNTTKLNLTDDQMQYVFTNIGTNPAMLLKLVQLVHDEATLKAFVENVLADADQDLVDFPHKAILKALKDQPGGVSPKYFNNHKNEGVDLSKPKAVGVSMKDSNVIVYHIELRMYKLMSKAHETALKSYEPIIVA
jgi:hypothetical protein